MTQRTAFALVLAIACAPLPGCDRHVEPFDPDERVEQPDLAKIFPPGAAQAADTASPMGGSPPGAMGAPPGGTGRGTPPPGAEAAARVPVGDPIRGTLRLAPALEGRVPSGAVLFLVARTGPGGPPTAVKRIVDPSFPIEFTIGPDDRMMAGIPFTGPFMLTARVDADRNATTRTPGDLKGAAASPISPGTSGVEILIDEVL